MSQAYKVQETLDPQHSRSYFARLAYRYPAPRAFYAAIGRDLTRIVRSQKGRTRIFNSLASLLLALVTLLSPFSAGHGAATGPANSASITHPVSQPSSMSAPLFSPADDARDLFLRKPVLGNSSYGCDPGFNPPRDCQYLANDGDDATAWWAHNTSTNEYWRVDLGATQAITQIKILQNSTSYATAVDVYGAIEGLDLEQTLLVDNTSLTSGWNTINIPSEFAGIGFRYYWIRARGLSNPFPDNNWVTYTIQGFGASPFSPPPGDVFRGATSQGSCPQTCSSHVPAKANDGYDGSFWHSNLSNNFWEVDFGTSSVDAKAITTIRILQAPLYGNYGTSFKIEASADQTNWVQLANNVTGNRGWTQVSLTPTQAYRYYRVVMLAASSTTFQVFTIEGYTGDPLLTRDEVRAPNLSEGHCPRCDSGQPINTATGNFWHTFSDLFVPGRGVPLHFSRTYNSLASDQSGRLGYGWTDNYNMYVITGTTVYTVYQENGSVVPFPITNTQYSRVEASLTHNVDGTFVMTRTHGLDRFYFMPVDSSGEAKLYQMVDRNGYTTTLSYDGGGVLQTVTDPVSRTLTLEYADGLLESVHDSFGREVAFKYNGDEELIEATDVGGLTTYFTYDIGGTDHRLLTITDPNGGVLTNDYDSSDRAIEQTDPMGRTLEFGYASDSISATTRITNELGLVTVHYYSEYLPVRVVQMPGEHEAVINYSYRPGTTQLESVRDPNGRITSYTWDTNNNLLSVTDPLSRVTQYAYNATSDLTIITSTNSITTSLAYDQWGNITSITHPVTETSQLITTTLTYDPIYHGDVITITDPLTHSIGIGYNNYGYPVTTTNQVAATAVFTYNSVGWLLKSEDPMHHVISTTHNLYGLPLIVTNTLGYTTTYGYDDNQNLITVQDANHKAITYTHNLDNEVTRITRPDGKHSDYGYDGLGRVITQTNALTQTTLYGFDDINRRVVMTDALNRSSSAAYDLVGATTNITDARGLTTTLRYDAAYQLRSITYGSSVIPNVSFDYNSLGMRTVMTDGIGSGTSFYDYDSLNRLTSLEDGFGKLVSYGYDNASRLTSITYPDDGLSTRTVTRGYDAANRLTSVQDWSSNTSQFGYNADGLLTDITYPNGITSTIGYNAADQLTSISHNSGGTPFLPLSYTRDPVGVLNAANEATRGTHGYEYDALYRLTGDDLNTGTTISSTWGYDAATQIVQTSYKIGTGTPITTVRTYDAANQFVSFSEDQGSTTNKKITFTFDNNGNRTRQYDSIPKQPTNYVYDAANRLVEYNTDDDGIIYSAYRYSGDGLRYSKENCAGPCLFTEYTWDIGIEAGLPLLLEDGEASYIYGPGGMILEEVTGGREYYYHHDQLGSVRSLTDGGGSETDTYDYDAYGNKLPTSTGSTYNPFGYTGEYTDSESGMLYLRARYYDPATQQFLTRDTFASLTEQPYAYAASSPLNVRDPSGHFWDILADAAFIVWDVADIVINGPNTENTAALAADAAGALVPFATGGGLIARAGVHAASHADDVGSIISHADELADAAAGICRATELPGQITVIGRRTATNLFKNRTNINVLDLETWSWNKNKQWLNGAINRGDSIFVASPTVRGNLVNPFGHREHGYFTIFGREIKYLQSRGYKQVGDYMVKTFNVP